MPKLFPVLPSARRRALAFRGVPHALARTYPDIAAAVQGVQAVRECAATSRIPEPRTPPRP